MPRLPRRSGWWCSSPRSAGSIGGPGASPDSAPPTIWLCPTCEAERSTAFCGDCGEESPRPHDLTLRGFLAELFKELSKLDGRLVRSFRLLILQPGALTAAHVSGQRRSFLGPLQLFLLTNAIFFAVQSISKINIFSTHLASHLSNQDWSPLARTLVNARLAAKKVTLAAYAPAFDQAVIVYAKSLLILMPLAFVPVLMLIFVRQRRPIGVHVMFALHLYAFILLLFCLSLMIAETHLLGGGLDSPRVDMILTLFNVMACAAYVYFATGRAYFARGWFRLAESLVLGFVIGAIVPGYRFVIFLITLYTT